MNDLINVIKDWPALVQGALGSGIFWLVLYIGQKFTSLISDKAQLHSTKKNKKYLYNEILRHKAVRDGNEFQSGAFYSSVLWFRASRNVINGLIWLTLGLIFGSIIGVFGIVGYLGCLYYLFTALNIVKPVNYKGEDINQEIEKLQKAYDEIKSA